MISCGNCPYSDDCEENDECPFGMTKMMKYIKLMLNKWGVHVNKALMWIAIILIALSGFSIKVNNFKFEWLGVLEIIIRIFK